MMTQQDAKNLIDKVFSFSKLPECEVDVQWTEDDFIRYAVNGITTSAYRVTQQISITSTTADKRSGNAAVSEISDEALKRGVEQAEELAKISRPDPEDMPALGPQKYPKLVNFDAFTGAARGNAMIPHIRAVIDAAKARNFIAAGYVQRSANAVAVGNKAGLFGYTTYTDSSLTNTMRNAGGTSSGWASQSSVSMKDLSGETVARISVEKCADGDNKKQLEPGKYTVVFEPAAVGDLIGWLGFDLGARDAEQGQSFLSKKGGGTHLGEKMFPEYITLRSDPFERRFSTTPWGSTLLPNRKIPWIEKGVVKNMVYDRYWASEAGKEPTPSATNLVLDGQDNSLEDLIKSVDRGLLVTRLWYIRVVQPQTWQLTGLTRDGLFLIENGKVTDRVTNFRWNESPVEVLRRTTKLGRPVRVTGDETGSQMAPPLVTTEFNMASVSDAV